MLDYFGLTASQIALVVCIMVVIFVCLYTTVNAVQAANHWKDKYESGAFELRQVSRTLEMLTPQRHLHLSTLPLSVQIELLFSWAQTHNPYKDQLASLPWENMSPEDYALFSNAPAPDSYHRHENGAEYRFLFVANAHSQNFAKYPPTAVYIGVNGKIWCRPLHDWDRSLKQVPLSETKFLKAA